MAASDKQDRQARARLRAYQARTAVHEHKKKRRVRDNIGAGIAVALLLGLAITGQVLYFTTGPAAPPAAPDATQTPGAENQKEVPPASLAENRTWTGTLTLNNVPLGIQLDGAAAPQAVSSGISLIQSGFYNNVGCHRLTKDSIWVLQCGDPKGDGSGGPGYSYGPIENAPTDGVYPAGTIAMARQGGNANSQGSQFFIVYQDTTLPADAAGGYTVIGHVTSGLDQLHSEITNAGISGGSSDGAPAVPVKITSVTIQ